MALFFGGKAARSITRVVEYLVVFTCESAEYS